MHTPTRRIGTFAGKAALPKWRRPWRNRIAQLAIGGAVAWLCAGCNTSKTYPATVSLCAQPEPAPGWTGNVFHQASADYGEIDYVVTVSDAAPRPTAAAGVDDATYTVAISGLSGGQHAKPPIPAHPMLYEPSGAWLESDGRRIPADPVARLADPLTNRPGAPLGASRVDLNSTATGTLQVFVTFAVPRQAIHHPWRVHLGMLQLGGEQVLVPDYRSCLSPAHSGPAQPWQS